MTCADILQIPELSGLQLLAGEEGLQRAVRWLYFAESTGEVADIATLKNWVSGGELFVCTNEKLLEDAEFVSKLIEDAYTLQASGIVLNVGSVQPQHLELGNRLGFPILEIPWTIRLIDLSQLICTQLIQEQNQENNKEHLLNTLLFTNFKSEERLLEEGRRQYFELRQPCQVAVFSLTDSTKSTADTLLSRLKRSIKSQFSQFGIGKVLASVQEEAVVVLYPTADCSPDRLQQLVQGVQTEWACYHPETKLTVGVGKEKQALRQFKQSYEEAKRALQLLPILAPEQSLFCFASAGFYGLLFQMDKEQEFSEYVEQLLGDLLEYDRLNHANLCDTLEAFLAHNKNIGLTAEALYIHRNTLRYRLDKIHTLLNEDFEQLDQVVNYILAFKIRRYLQTVSRG